MGEFVRCYPAPGCRYDQYAPLVRSLLNATTGLAIVENPTDATRDAWDAALAAETLGTLFYPVLIMAAGSFNVAIVPLWLDANVGFYDWLSAMSEGSGV